MVPSRPQGDPQQRVSCPNCHANNFIGQPQCWQCRAPLLSGVGRPQNALGFPSPAVQPAPPMQPAQYAQPGASGGGSSARPNVLLLVGIAMMTFVVVLKLYINSQSGTPAIGRSTERSATAAIEANRAAADPTAGMQSGQEGGVSPDASDPSAAPNAGSASANTGTTGATRAGGDPLEDAARRVITREAPNVGLPPPAAASADGQVHLRTGGTISTEEWNAARRTLQGNPLLKEPPPPPPF